MNNEYDDYEEDDSDQLYFNDDYYHKRPRYDKATLERFAREKRAQEYIEGLLPSDQIFLFTPPGSCYPDYWVDKLEDAIEKEGGEIRSLAPGDPLYRASEIDIFPLDSIPSLSSNQTTDKQCVYINTENDPNDDEYQFIHRVYEFPNGKKVALNGYWILYSSPDDAEIAQSEGDYYETHIYIDLIGEKPQVPEGIVLTRRESHFTF